MRYAKPVTVATAKAVAAGNSGRQDDVIAAANMGRKAVFDLLHACKVKQAPCEVFVHCPLFILQLNQCSSSIKPVFVIVYR